MIGFKSTSLGFVFCWPHLFIFPLFFLSCLLWVNQILFGSPFFSSTVLGKTNILNLLSLPWVNIASVYVKCKYLTTIKYHLLQQTFRAVICIYFKYTYVIYYTVKYYFFYVGLNFHLVSFFLSPWRTSFSISYSASLLSMNSLTLCSPKNNLISLSNFWRIFSTDIHFFSPVLYFKVFVPLSSCPCCLLRVGDWHLYCSLFFLWLLLRSFYLWFSAVGLWYM